MSIDLTDAIEAEAATVCYFLPERDRCGEHSYPQVPGKPYCVSGYTNSAETVELIAPIIAATVRAQVATEIEDAANWRGNNFVALPAVMAVYDECAALARGGGR